MGTSCDDRMGRNARNQHTNPYPVTLAAGLGWNHTPNARASASMIPFAKRGKDLKNIFPYVYVLRTTHSGTAVFWVGILWVRKPFAIYIPTSKYPLSA